MKFKCLIALLILSAPILSHAAMYKYQDAQGNWVYSQHPPADGDFKTIKPDKKSRSSRLSSEERDAKVKKARESVIGTPEDNKEKSKVAAESAKNADLRKESCAKSKEALTALQVYRRFTDKDGKTIRLDDDERAKRIQSAKDNIKQFCD